MGAAEDGGTDVELTVADIEDAYWNVPIAPQERKYFACQLRGRFFIFLRATQGSRGGPLLWARVMAFSARFGQATCSAKAARVNVYVDDPIILSKGSSAVRQLSVAKILIVWMALGMRIAWHKAQCGATVTWTSATFSVLGNSVVAKIKEEIVERIRQALLLFDTMNVIPEKALRKFTGRAVHVASLIFGWQPFVGMLWAPLCQDFNRQGAPLHCVWRRQIEAPLKWIAAFLVGQRGTLQRIFDAKAYHACEANTVLVCDASPWGLGGVVLEGGQPVAYLADAVTTEDSQILGFEFGPSKSQQATEALCILVCLRHWKKLWATLRSSLVVKSDSVTALTLVLYARARGHTTATIAREVALDVSEGVYRPSVVSHIAGITNFTADALSRLFEPGKHTKIPSWLDDVPRHFPPRRDMSWYRTLSPPEVDTPRFATGPLGGV